MLNTWLTILTLLDIIILGIIIYYLGFSNNRLKLSDIKPEKLEALKHSLKDILKESQKVSIRLSQYIDIQEAKGKEIEDRLNEKEKSLKKLLSEIENGLKSGSVKNKRPDKINADVATVKEDPYLTAKKMIKNGLDLEDIASRLNIPLSEIQLMSDLKKNT